MKYIALTLGPITRTIEMAENTRGLWAASYLFSYLGKKIIEPFKEREYLLPYISDEMFSKTFNGAGVFPDRYIFKVPNGVDDFTILKSHIEEVYDELVKKISPIVGNSNDVVKDYLKKYLKIYFFEKDFSDMSDIDIKTSCEKSLALLENQDSLIPSLKDEDSILTRFFDRVTNTFLTKDGGLSGGFPTIVKISSGETDEIPPHPYQRYVAVVKADGDSMGNAFSTLGEDSQNLSAALFEFNKAAVEIITKYKGLSVYIGGDDLLFFAPIFTESGSIFSLLKELDDSFHSNIKTKCPELKEHPTLSFGVSITYYKYPMFEALSLADNLLEKAKGKGEEKIDAPLKNNILFAVQKHSGQSREAVMHKYCCGTMEKFNELVSDLMTDIVSEDNQDEEKEKEKTKEKKMLSSVMHVLREKEFLLLIAIRKESTIKNFFDNNFNEVGHKKYSKFFGELRTLLWTAYHEYNIEGVLNRLKNSLPETMNGSKNMTAEKMAIEIAYNALQFVHLVNQRNDKQDENI